jgi:glycosyltransferase involved in cell wall biosynthesis
VCSEWAKQVCLKNLDRGEHRIHVVPLGVDSELFPPAPVRQDDKTIFFNCGKWEIRKGHDILMKAFEMVLGHGENAELWMMCSNPFNSEAENARWHQLYNHPKVRLIPRAETQAEVYNIMSRGEGWNLELLEMMSAGKHVVATNYSAHTEFCTKENSGLVEVSDVEPAFDGKWFFNQGNWARLGDHEQHDLYMKMIKFILDKKGTVNTAGIETAKRFSWDNTANKILQTLKG